MRGKLGPMAIIDQPRTFLAGFVKNHFMEFFCYKGLLIHHSSSEL